MSRHSLRILPLLFTLLLLLPLPARSQKQPDTANAPWLNTALPIDQRVDALIGKIRNCDGFVGIWRNQTMPDALGINISPCQIFEYGVARSECKPCFLVSSKELDERTWKQLLPESSISEFANDDEFERSIVPSVEAWCESHLGQR